MRAPSMLLQMCAVGEHTPFGSDVEPEVNCRRRGDSGSIGGAT